jgi:hypothetical protein
MYPAARALALLSAYPRFGDPVTGRAASTSSGGRPIVLDAICHRLRGPHHQQPRLRWSLRPSRRLRRGTSIETHSRRQCDAL